MKLMVKEQSLRLTGLLCLVFMVALVLAQSGGVLAWSVDPTVNTAICTASGYQSYPRIISDGSGGAIIAWSDGRSGSYHEHIYAQKVDSSGAVQWTDNGVAICTASGYQGWPQIISDGSGGAIITWGDSRNGEANFDIYAQRVNSSGAVQWTTNGVGICTALGDQLLPRIISDGSGGAIITWPDYRNGNLNEDIYAQRMDSSGAAQWTANGVAISTGSGGQGWAQIISDGSGGAIITWLTNSGSGQTYAQRVDSSGAFQWTPDGVAVCSGYSEVQLIPDGSGGAIITWSQDRSYLGNHRDIYASKVDSSGNVPWTADGIAVSNGYGDKTGPQLIPDGSGGAIITWGVYYPNRGLYSDDIYAQRVTPLTVTGIIADNKTYDGGTTATLDTGSATLVGVAGGDNVTLVTTGPTGAFADKNVGTGKTVTVSGLTLGGADANKYVLAQPTARADITAKALTVTGISADSKTYDGGTTAIVNPGSATLVGTVSGDWDVTLATTDATGAFANKNVGTGKTVTVSGLTLSGADASNYTLTPLTTTSDITAKALTVSGITASNKTYDGNTTATLNGTGSLAGVVSGDSVSLGGTASGTFADKNVGTGKTVTVSGLALSGADAGNYTLTPPTTTASITAKALTITATGVNKVYDGASSATVTLGSGDKISGDTVTFGYTGAAFDNKNVGTGKAVGVSGLSIGGADAGNYNLTSTSATTTANITAKALTVSGITASDKTYDGNTTATLNGTGSLAGVVSGDSVSLGGTATGTFADKNVGSGKTVTVSGLTISGADASNYSLTPPTPTADITAVDVTTEGGMVEVEHGRIVAEFPAGAVATTATVTIKQVEPSSAAAPKGFKVGNTFFTIEAVDGDGNAIVTFSKPVTITVKYSDEDVAAAGGDPSNLVLAYYDEAAAAWKRIDTTVKTTDKTLSATTSHLSTWAVLSKSPGGGLASWIWIVIGIAAAAVAGAGILTYFLRRRPRAQN
jgi:hypothetical protein